MKDTKHQDNVKALLDPLDEEQRESFYEYALKDENLEVILAKYLAESTKNWWDEENTKLAQLMKEKEADVALAKFKELGQDDKVYILKSILKDYKIIE